MVIRKVQLSKKQLSLWEQGSGPPLLFVHGFPLDHTMWMAQLSEFSTDHRVLAPDLPGFGSSDALMESEYSMRQFADDLAELLEVLRIDTPVVYCGLSMGGYIAWPFWQHHRKRLGSLVLCDTRAAADADEVARARRYMAARVGTDGTATIAAGMATKLFAKATLDEDGPRLNEMRQVMQQTRTESIAAAQRGMAARPDMSGQLPKIDVPTLLLVGEEDAITTANEMQEMAGKIPHAEFHCVPQAGHMAPLEQPLAVNSILRDFLTRHAR